MRAQRTKLQILLATWVSHPPSVGSADTFPRKGGRKTTAPANPRCVNAVAMGEKERPVREANGRLRG